MRLSLIMLAAMALMALSPTPAGAQGMYGSPQRGAALISQIGCGSCHIIPGIRGAQGLVGPPLDHMSRRIFIAGLLRNTPDNMMRWIMHPQAIVRGNAMPEMGLGSTDARDIASYLSTLK
jgi:cytochrome c2